MEPIMTPCAICGLPVGSPSMAGPGICPTCDMGKYRDGSQMDTTFGLDIVKERAKEIAGRVERERNLRQALADLVAAAEEVTEIKTGEDKKLCETFGEIWELRQSASRARKVMKEEA